MSDDVTAQGPRPAHTPLHGRDAERHAIDEVIRRLGARLSDTLVLAGEPGVGKTRLLQTAAAAASAAGLRVITISGVESELPLGFAALHHLLAPFLDRLERIPGPQGDALRRAFGLMHGPPPDQFLIGLATLSLLAEIASDRPLLCLVDDAHWLDRDSAQALAFVGRRLHAEGVGVLVALRESGAALFEGLPVRPVRGLRDAAARRLLAECVAGPLDDSVAERVVEQTDGNPLALITLATALSPEQLAGHTELPVRLPLGAHLETYFLGQVRALPPATRELLLVASIAPAHDQALLWRAGALLGLSPVVADPALAEGILLLGDLAGGSVTFRHPLIRAAVYNASTPADRRRAHRALADSSDPVLDPDTRAWHLAAATAGTDEGVARDLEASAERAGARGGHTAQAAFLARAAELSPDAPARGGRLLAAAGAFLVAGDIAAVRRLLDQARPLLHTPVARAMGERLRAAVTNFDEGAAHAPAILMAAAAALGGRDARLTRVMLREALETAMVALEQTVGTTPLDVARAVLADPADPAGTVADLLARAFATRVTAGYRAAVPLMRAAVAELCTAERLSEEGMPLALLGALAADELWDEQGRSTLLHRLAASGRESGALHALRVTLTLLAGSELRAGRLAVADAHYAENFDLYAMSGVMPPGGSQWQIEQLVWQGREQEARAAADQIAVVAVHNVPALVNQAALAMTVLELSLGNYREALDRARPLFDRDPPGNGNRVLPDLVEAAVRAGDPDTARLALARLEERAPISAMPWGLGLLARSRALLGEQTGGDAEPLYRQALELLGRTRMRIDLARTHLLYGEWLRRHRRRGEAGAQLRTAHEMFAAMGAGIFTERVRVELAATGERVAPPAAPVGPVLTPQETKIATLAAEGATNAEIARRLYVSTSTVEYHLTKIFRKLRLTSRRQLRELFTDGPAR
ncbi:LuxR family transcriptional regulator [Planotetraspora phitsanulokensis]|uniref:Transcriptional regulator n=1 Tax=Planotetraspora phitsanulokensis TaxID=575192 RepID=A0A8J3XGH0_9ACTN|nr:LuxR family transcriptional regulator [Planotetraspora phitsanulokensis]GII39021.1 transcriptional regulator [Planotetraspora phitsanulokensis]